MTDELPITWRAARAVADQLTTIADTYASVAGVIPVVTAPAPNEYAAMRIRLGWPDPNLNNPHRFVVWRHDAAAISAPITTQGVLDVVGRLSGRHRMSPVILLDLLDASQLLAHRWRLACDHWLPVIITDAAVTHTPAPQDPIGQLEARLSAFALGRS